MIGVVVVAKYFEPKSSSVKKTSSRNFSGLIDYMDRPAAIKNNFPVSVHDVKLDEIDKKILRSMSSNGNSNIDLLFKDKQLKNMICFKENLFGEKKLTRYDANYIFKKYFNNDHKFNINYFESIYNKTNKSKKACDKEKKRVISRLEKLIEMKFVTKVDEKTYELSNTAIQSIGQFKDFDFTSYDVNKIFPLVRDHKFIKSIDLKLDSEFNLETKEGKYVREYIRKRIENNIKFGTLIRKDGKLIVSKKGCDLEDKILYPHKKFLEAKIKALELNSDEFKRKVSILDENYSVDNAFSGMIGYMDRNKARKKKRKSALFTDNKDHLEDGDKMNLKKIFDNSQKHNGIMWHDIISFDNAWLEKYGVYDSKTKMLDEIKLKEVARNGINEMLRKENLYETSVWCGDIHYNTDNIHIHFSTVEITPDRTRKKIKYKSILAAKSKVVNGIMDNSLEYQNLTKLVRENIVGSKKNVNSLKDIKLKKMFLEIYNNLPEDRRQWNYKYNTLKDVRPLIDKMTETYIDCYAKDDYELLKRELKKQQEKLKEAYGVGNKFLYENFYDNKLKDVKVRMGNSILKEIKTYDRSLRGWGNKNLSIKERKELLKNAVAANRIRSLKYEMKRVAKDLNKDTWKNQNEYEKLQKEIERVE